MAGSSPHVTGMVDEQQSFLMSSVGSLRLFLSPILLLALAATALAAERGNGVRGDVQQIGLAPLYEVLFAVANCPNVALDEPAFRRAARLYRLSTADLTIGGRFSDEIVALEDFYRVRLEDDRAAFCSVSRLRFAIPTGVLVDRGPVVPHPLPFASAPY